MATLTVAYLLRLNSPWRLDAGLRSAILLGTVLTHLPTYSGYLLAGEAAAVNQGAARSTCEVALRCSWFKFSLGTRYTRQVYNYLKPLVHCTRDTASAGQEHCKHNFKKKPVGSPESQSNISEGVGGPRAGASGAMRAPTTRRRKTSRGCACLSLTARLSTLGCWSGGFCRRSTLQPPWGVAQATPQSNPRRPRRRPLVAAKSFPVLTGDG